MSESRRTPLNKNNNATLHSAAAAVDLYAFNVPLENTVFDINATDDNGHTVLYEAVNALLSEKDVDAADIGKLLRKAAKVQCVKTVELLLEKDANPNTEYNQNTLDEVVERSNAAVNQSTEADCKIVALFLKKNISFMKQNGMNNPSYTLLHKAVCGNVDIFKLFLQVI